MQSVVIFVALIAVASAGVLAPVAVHTPVVVRSAPVVHVAHAPVVRTVVPVAQSSSFSYRAPAAKLAVPVVHAAPVFHAAPAVAVVRSAPIVHSAPVLVH